MDSRWNEGKREKIIQERFPKLGEDVMQVRCQRCTKTSEDISVCQWIPDPLACDSIKQINVYL